MTNQPLSTFVEEAREYYDRWTVNAFVQDLPLGPSFHEESDRRWRAVEEAIRADERRRIEIRRSKHPPPYFS